MPLRHRDVRPGVIAFLSSSDITTSTRVITPADNAGRTFRDGPWLCVASDGQHCSWLTMTSRQLEGGHRMQIPRSAFVCGPYRMLTRINYLTDLRAPYSGPVEVFVQASRIDRAKKAIDLPRVGKRFLDDVMARMRYHHSVPRWIDDLAMA